MKLLNYELNLNNIKAFIQANTRIFIDKFGSDFIELPLHIKEQILYRATQANQDCIKQGVCKCNCNMKDMLYADKSCPDKCYPQMMNVEDWEQFKSKLNNNFVTNQLSNPEELTKQIDKSFEVVKLHTNNSDNTQLSIYQIAPALFINTSNLGNLEKCITHKQVFTIQASNNLVTKLNNFKLVNVYPACGCTTSKIIKSDYTIDNKFEFEIEINLTNKSIGEWNIVLDCNFELNDQPFNITYVILANIIECN